MELKPFEQGMFILQDRDGDYVKAVESGGTETVPIFFVFTKNREEARKFDYKTLWSPLNVHGVGTEWTSGFAGGRAIQVE